jgi:hypothetical protein
MPWHILLSFLIDIPPKKGHSLIFEEPPEPFVEY